MALTRKEALARANELAKEAVQRYPKTVDEAATWLRQQTKTDGIDSKLVDIFVTRGYNELVEYQRHQNNRKMRKSAGQYGSPPRALPGDGATAAANMSILATYSINGTVLGELTGEELPGLRIGFRATEGTAKFLGDFFENLERRVKGKKKVKNVLNEQQVRRICSRLGADPDNLPRV